MKTAITEHGKAKILLNKSELIDLIYLIAYSTELDIIDAGCNVENILEIEKKLQALKDKMEL